MSTHNAGASPDNRMVAHPARYRLASRTARVNAIACSLLVIVFTASILLCSGCAHHPAVVLGAEPHGSLTSVKSASHLQSGRLVTVKGEMTEKCPVAGCWFILKDGSGAVRVDTKSAGFVVSDVPLHTTLTVAGAVTSGGGLAATGVRY